MTGEVLMQQDPVTFEVVRGGLYAICEEMKSVMMRASFSPLLSLSADLSCAILDQKGDVVAQGNDIPVHLGAMPFSAKGIIDAFPLETFFSHSKSTPLPAGSACQFSSPSVATAYRVR